VLEVGKRYTSPKTGTWVQIAERAGPDMKFERSFPPGTGKADPHLHEDFTQTWEALSGDGMIEIDGSERPFRVGDRVTIEPGTRHRDPWNLAPTPLEVRGLFEPSNDFVETYAEAYAHRLTEGGLNGQDEMPFLQVVVIVRATDGRSWGAFPPVAIQKLSLPLIAALGRLRGYMAQYD